MQHLQTVYQEASFYPTAFCALFRHDFALRAAIYKCLRRMFIDLNFNVKHRYVAEKFWVKVHCHFTILINVALVNDTLNLLLRLRV